MIGLRVQIGNTHASVRWPFYWEIYTNLMYPRLYGFGIWVERGDG